MAHTHAGKIVDISKLRQAFIVKVIFSRKGFDSAHGGFHSPILQDSDSWKERYFQSEAIGQEFVVKDIEKVEEWAKNIR